MDFVARQQGYARRGSRSGYLLAALRVQLAWARLAQIERWKAGFNPDQPRDDHGRWTDAGGSVGTQQPAPAGDRIQLAGDITGFTRHGINQAINRGVSPTDIHDAVVNPIQILPQASGTTRYIGAGAVVVLDPAGRVVTTWRRGR